MLGFSNGYFGWAENASGTMVHVGEVERGLACGCYCVTCSRPVLARQGTKRIWHFAHRADTTCEGESALHRAAKAVLVEAAEQQLLIRLPSGLTPRLEAATTESPIGKTRKADVLATIGGRSYGIEIRVTHAKNQAARDDYAVADVEAFEIDLRKVPHHLDRGELTRAVLDGADRHWLYKRGLPNRTPRAHSARTARPATRPESYEEITNKVIDYLTSRNGQNDPFVSWPVIRADGITRLAASQAQWERGTVSPKLYMVRRPGIYTSRESGGPRLRIEGKVATPKGVARVDVELVFDIISPSAVERPTLLIVCPGILVESSWPGALFMQWHGIDSWRDKLTSIYHSTDV
ncbi:hypothetical protein J7355_13185 [Endozoicomonas sp. G2_2]|uniref:competence protein CoiA family protein n=1 Tax=Endozoicomonas sp. G2_2 TaxID=2821092 RepID=UPI001ADAC6DB|nr:competence protein CoiA family protein [Endozoicomonas sp. G2_2]MBO9471048.1 hypothetical protein [Endozoicomonas sp. G2_2]